MATTTLYTSYSQHANATITVTTNAELNAALAQLDTGGGGTILLDGNGGPFTISGSNIGDANNPILIKALDPSNLPTVESIDLQNASHIAMTELHVDSSGSAASTGHDIIINGSDNIELVGNTMTSVADGYLSEAGTSTRGADLAYIRGSQDITFSNNYIADYCKGVTFRDVNGFDFSNNEMVGIQFDGLHGTGWQNATISNNYMHDFYGSTQTLNHSDFIQVYSTNATLVTSNVTISGNILDSGDGAAYQGIFITSQTFGNSGPSGQYYQDIQIFDNLVHTGKWNGIVVGSTMGAEIYDNSVLLSANSYAQSSPTSSWTQGEPWIKTTNTPDAQVYDNIASKITVSNGDVSSQNYLISFSDPTSTAYFANHFTNLDGSGDLTLDDMSLLASSSLYGTYGSYYSTVGGTWDAGASQPTAPTGGSTSPTPTPTPTPTPPPTTTPDDTTTIPDDATTTPDDTTTPPDDTTTTPDDTTTTTPDTTTTDTTTTDADSEDLVEVFNKSVGLLKAKFTQKGNQKNLKDDDQNSWSNDIKFRALIESMQIVDENAVTAAQNADDDEENAIEISLIM
ncbi:MAG: right-handed parallel beta-helix repeat-containing protein [Marinosulfonomonas sp.]|nr:right-handed parallel beta-helix repeat-containing protein [Marinosulfonomonas sp.]